MMQAVFEVSPFDALSPELADSVAHMLRPEDFSKDQLILGTDHEPAAYILLEGEVDIEISGKPEQTFGPGTLIGVLVLFVPGLANLGTVRAKSDVKCLGSSRKMSMNSKPSRPSSTLLAAVWRVSGWISSNGT